MNNISQLTLFQFRILYRNKIAFFFNLIYPLLMVLTFGLLYGTPAAPAAETVVGGVSAMEVVAEGELANAVAGMGEMGAVGEAVAAAQLGEGAHSTAQVLDATDASAERQLTTFDYLIPGQMTVMLLSAGFITVAFSVAGQRASGVLRHLFSTPMSMSGWIASRTLANGLMAVLQGFILFGFAYAVFSVSPPANVPGTIVVVAVVTLLSLSLGLLIGVLVKGEEMVMAVAFPIFMLLVFLGNAAMPLENVPRIIAGLLPYVPSYYMTEALRAVMMFGDGIGAVARELAIMGGLAVVMFAVALWRLRRQFVIAS